MNCPKCGKNIPDGNIFCTGCGFNISQYKAQQEQNIPPRTEPQYYAYPASAPVKAEKKTNPVLWAILGALILALILTSVYAISLKTKNDEYLGEISDNSIRLAQLEREASAKDNELKDVKEALETVTAERDEYEEISELFIDLLDYIASEDSWGYCTENFHADKGIMVMDLSKGTQELRIFSTYYTTFTFEIDDTSVINAKWADKEWTEKETQILVTPVEYGITTITLTNKLYTNSFKVLVIVI